MILVWLVLLLDVLSFSMIIPLYEKLAAYYSVTPGTLVLGMTIFSLASFLSTPLLGQLSDKYGRKWPLFVCVLSTALSFLILAFTQNIFYYFISRFIGGIVGGNISILRSIIIDLSDHQSLSKNFGIFGAIFGLSFVIGPLIGSALYQLPIQTAFLVATAVGIIETLLVAFFLKETNKKKREKIHLTNPLVSIWKILSDSTVGKLLQSNLSYIFGLFVFQSVASVWLPEQITLHGVNITGQYVGYMLAVIGVVSIIVQARFLPKIIIPRFTTDQIMKLGFAGNFIALGLLYVVRDFWLFTALWGLWSFFGAFISLKYQTLVVQNTDPSKQGEISGVLSGLQTLTMAISPLLGGYLVDNSVNIFSAVIICVTLSYVVYLRSRRHLRVMD